MSQQQFGETSETMTSTKTKKKKIKISGTYDAVCVVNTLHSVVVVCSSNFIPPSFAFRSLLFHKFRCVCECVIVMSMPILPLCKNLIGRMVDILVSELIDMNHLEMCRPYSIWLCGCFFVAVDLLINQ